MDQETSVAFSLQDAGIGNLVDFHTRHKLQVLSHSPQHHQQVGKLVARAKEFSLEDVNHYVREYDEPYLKAQHYLRPTRMNSN